MNLHSFVVYYAEYHDNEFYIIMTSIYLKTFNGANIKVILKHGAYCCYYKNSLRLYSFVVFESNISIRLYLSILDQLNLISFKIQPKLYLNQ